MKTKVITLCASFSFYKELLEIATELKKRGLKVLVPATAAKIKRNNFNYNKTWFTDPKDWKLKTNLIKGHLKKVAMGDSILVINALKHDQEGYIGGNVLMEMTVAFYLKKKIYLWRPPAKNSPLYEEIMGINPIIINQDLTKIN